VADSFRVIAGGLAENPNSKEMLAGLTYHAFEGLSQLDSKKGTAARVRVLTEWSDQQRTWATVGVSDNLIAASWKALLSAVTLELARMSERDSSVDRVVEDYCWAV
jgi:hypothetical protein